MSSQNVINTAIYTRLAGTAGTALTTLLAGGTASPAVFYAQAPDNQTLPYVVWLFPSGVDANIIPHRMKDVIVRAYAVAAAPAQAGTIDAAIDTLLRSGTLTLGTGTTWRNIRLQRENDYQIVSTSEQGVRYYTAGADYRANITQG